VRAQAAKGGTREAATGQDAPARGFPVAPDVAPADRIAALAAEVEALRDEVARLRDRLAELEAGRG
jgi:uncharacterized protein YceH (UPF0502 family)